MIKGHAHSFLAVWPLQGAEGGLDRPGAQAERQGGRRRRRLHRLQADLRGVWHPG